MPSKKKKNILQSYVDTLNGTSVSSGYLIADAATTTSYTYTLSTSTNAYTTYYNAMYDTGTLTTYDTGTLTTTGTFTTPEYYTYTTPATFVDTKFTIGCDPFKIQMLFENELIEINEKGEVFVDGKLELNPTKIGRALLKALEKYRQEDLNDPKDFFNKD